MPIEFETRDFPDAKPLNQFSKSCFYVLSRSVVLIPYPKEMKPQECKERWGDFRTHMDLALSPILDSVSGRGGVYALVTQNKQGVLTVQYIGQSAAKHARSRIRAHLINRNRGTGAQLESVQAHFATGGHIGFSFVEINPVELRHYVEAWLISRVRPDWNLHGIDRAQLNSPGGHFDARNRHWKLGAS